MNPETSDLVEYARAVSAYFRAVDEYARAKGRTPHATPAGELRAVRQASRRARALTREALARGQLTLPGFDPEARPA